MKCRWISGCLALVCYITVVAVAAEPEGFGAATPGGDQGTEVAVTSLLDNGPGTLREALTGNNRRIVFKVSGSIWLGSQLDIRGKEFLTIDGATAPAPGITLTAHGLDIRDSHDIIVRHLRIRGTVSDGIMVRRGSYNVVIDHCSITNAGDENIGITQGARNVTVSWSIIGDTRPDSFELKTKGMLITHRGEAPVTDVSLHHNLFVNLFQRNPQISSPGVFDLRNNIIRNWRSYGIRLRDGARGNIVNNVFATKHNREKAVLLMSPGHREAAGPVYMDGNASPRGMNLNALRTAHQPYEVPQVTTYPVKEVEARVLPQVGAMPRDEIDAALLQGMAEK